MGIYMQLKYHNYSLSAITGLAAFIIFTISILISVFLYPTYYNPLYGWLSNLGNVNLNPSGAIFFNWGCIITGLILIPFFVGLYAWKPRKIWGKILLVLGMVIGIFAAISLIMVGIYPETESVSHFIAATSVFSSLFLIIILINLALYENPKFIRGVAYFGVLAIIVDITFQYIVASNKDILAVFNPTTPVPGLEWASTWLSMIWLALLALNMLIKKV
jgi:hypothetical membrane protein